VVNRLETLRQGKKTAEELNTEFLQIVGQAGMDRKTPSDHLYLIGYYRKTLEPRLSRRILFSNDVPKTMDGWMEKAIQFDTNWRMGNLFFNQDLKGNSSKQKADTNKSNRNTPWWRTNKRRDPNAMDVDALTMEERGMLLRREMFPLQKDRTYGKILPTGARRVVKTEEGRPGKVCLHHDQGAHKGAEGKFHKDGDGG
jgi:hypothetical protein